MVGVGPLIVPSILVGWRILRREGWLGLVQDPAVVGVVLALGICAWSFITVDLTPRLFWIGFPFAASLTARWLSEGRQHDWIEGHRLRVIDLTRPGRERPLSVRATREDRMEA